MGHSGILHKESGTSASLTDDDPLVEKLATGSGILEETLIKMDKHAPLPTS